MSSKKEQDGSEDSSESDEMTKEELHRKVREHMERRREAYEKMGSVDKPR